MRYTSLCCQQYGSGCPFLGYEIYILVLSTVWQWLPILRVIKYNLFIVNSMAVTAHSQGSEIYILVLSKAWRWLPILRVMRYTSLYCQQHGGGCPFLGLWDIHPCIVNCMAVGAILRVMRYTFLYCQLHGGDCPFLRLRDIPPCIVNSMVVAAHS